MTDVSHPDTLSSVALACNPHSTTSPRASPQLDLLTSTSQLSSPQDDEISVTASSKGSPAPDDRPGAFTTVLKSKNDDLSVILSKKHELMQKNHDFSHLFHHKNHDLNAFLHNGGQHVGHPHGNLFNNALAAQLFLNTPLLQPPNQWLYSQLYQGGYEWPWLQMRHPSLLPTNARENASSPDTIRVEDSSQESQKHEETPSPVGKTPEHKSATSKSTEISIHKTSTHGINLSKKKSPSASSKYDSDASNVSSSKRSSSPLTSSGRTKSGGERNTTTRHSDVWRPY